MIRKGTKLENLVFRVVPGKELNASERDAVHRLFERSYEKPNHAYLDKSLSNLTFITVAYNRDALVCFSVGDVVKTNIPGISEPQIAVAGGLSCIDPAFRKMGLFGYLQKLLMNENGLDDDSRFIMGGRMAHPVSYRVIEKFPGAIPKRGLVLSDWHKEVGLHFAKIYNVSIDPETFVVKGSGSPIGIPKLEMNINDEDWEIFKHVDRDRGDSLLCIAWYPEAPVGW